MSNHFFFDHGVRPVEHLLAEVPPALGGVLEATAREPGRVVLHCIRAAISVTFQTCNTRRPHG